MADEYPRIGADPLPESDTYALHLSDFAEKLIPPVGVEAEPFDPTEYYITSGDAIQKADRLCKDIYIYCGKIRSILYRHPLNEELKLFEQHCWKVAGALTSMKKALEKARGPAIFLETEWEHSIILCIPKNPRPKKV